jgi:xanthine dehydrogenase accessory factor
MPNELIARIYQELGQENGVVLATILKRIGSAPRSGGSRMLVFTDHTIFGTIGGGKIEAQVREIAHEVLVTKRAQLKDFHFSGSDAASMDMICGGSVTILVEWLDPYDPILVETFRKLVQIYTAFENSWWIQAVQPDLQIEHGCYSMNWDSVWGTHLDLGVVGEVKQLSWLETSPTSYFIERLNLTGTVLIFGAGHVAQPVAHLCHLVDFHTVVIDDRLEFANQERFPDADEIFVSNLSENEIATRAMDENTYVVIVTRGHMNDLVVLESVLTTKAGYIGMIGSRRKWKLIVDELVNKGYSTGQIARVHTPIGLEIGAETPAEIAISIVAELVKDRAGRQNSAI